MKLIVTGSIAFDYLMSFPGKFTEHFLATGGLDAPPAGPARYSELNTWMESREAAA